MPDTQGLRFEDISNLEILKDFYKIFFDLTGLIVDYNDVEGRECRVYSAPEDANPFCRLIKANAEGLRRCTECSRTGGYDAAKLGKPHVYECHAGLMDIAVPLIMRGKHVATICAGQILLEQPTAEGFLRIKARLKELKSIDFNALEKYYMETKVLSPSRLGSILNLISLVANYVVEMEDKVYFLQQAHEQQCVSIAKNYISSNFKRELSLNELAAHAHVSPFHLSKVFKKQTGMTVGDYIVKTRLAAARQLLMDSSLSVMDVAAEVGYDSHNHFSRLFKRIEGITPSHYRKRNNNRANQKADCE